MNDRKQDRIEYTPWRNMKARCLNPRHPFFSDYGGRGITVHPAWVNNFWDFLEDVGDRPSLSHTLERSDNSKGYFPGNVVWANWTQQARNRRSSRYIEFGGRNLTLAEWAETTGLSKTAIFMRVNARGWPVDKALTAPLGERLRTT